MNILFFQDTFAVGGGEIWIADTAVKLRDRGHGVTIGCPCGSWMAHQAEAREIPYFDYLMEEEFEGSLRWQLLECLLEREIDLICCGIPGGRPEVPLLDAAVREAGHGSILLRLGVSPGPGALQPERIGLGLDTVGGIIVVSQDIKMHLLKEFPSLQPERIHVLYNGIDLEKFDPEAYRPADRRELRDRFDIPEGHSVVGTVGRLDPIKNLPMLIQAAESVVEQCPGTTFLVVGEGSEKHALIEAAESAGVLDSFRFAGFVEDIPRLLYSLDLLVHTSLSEGIPNAVLEAMAMGKPVVATDVGGIPELIEDGRSGLLVSPTDVPGLSGALRHLLKQPEGLIALGRAARQRAETAFDRRAKLEELEALFHAEACSAEAPHVFAPQAAPELEDLPSLFFERACALQKVS